MDNVLNALMQCRDTAGHYVELANPHYYKMPNGQMVAFASDAHTLLVVKNVEGYLDKWEFEPTTNPNIASAIPTEPCNQSLNAANLCGIFAQVPTLPYRMVRCPECAGDGDVYWRYTDSTDKEHIKPFPCPICYGRGEVKREGTTLDKNYAFEMGEVQFTVGDIERLCNLLNILGIADIPMVLGRRTLKLENDDYLIVVSAITEDNRHKRVIKYF